MKAQMTRFAFAISLSFAFCPFSVQAFNGSPVTDFVASEVPSHVFGANNRVRVSENTEWKKFVGRLVNHATGGACTASLVGKDLLLTAAHCILPATYPLEALEFQQSYAEGKMIGRSGVIQWWANAKYDYAILRLASPLGDESVSKQQGFFNVLSVNLLSDWMVGTVMLAGYGKYFSGAEFLTAQNCRVRNYSHYFLHHDCDIDFGDSGAPVFIDHPQFGWSIVAIHSIARTVNGEMRALPRYDSNLSHFGASYWAWAPSLSRIKKGSR